MGRPKNKHKTVTKTYSYYEEDILEMQDLRTTAKHLLNLGLAAHKAGWNNKGNSGELETLKKRISTLGYTLELYVERSNKLIKIVEKKLDVDLNEDVTSDKRLDELLDQLDKEDKEE